MALMHLSTHQTAIGQRIQSSHWATYLNTTGLPITSTFEKMLEQERINLNNPNLVSRLNCVFSFDAPEMQNYYLGRPGHIHHLDTTGLNVSTHNYEIITFFSHLFAANNVVLLYQEINLMQLYWTGGATSNYISSTGQVLGYTPEHLIDGAPLVTKIT